MCHPTQKILRSVVWMEILQTQAQTAFVKSFLRWAVELQMFIKADKRLISPNPRMD